MTPPSEEKGVKLTKGERELLNDLAADDVGMWSLSDDAKALIANEYADRIFGMYSVNVFITEAGRLALSQDAGR